MKLCYQLFLPFGEERTLLNGRVWICWNYVPNTIGQKTPVHFFWISENIVPWCYGRRGRFRSLPLFMGVWVEYKVILACFWLCWVSLFYWTICIPEVNNQCCGFQTLVRREKERVHRRHREAELKFSQDFTTQQTSVSKALLRHDRQLRRDTKVQRNVRISTPVYNCLSKQYRKATFLTYWVTVWFIAQISIACRKFAVIINLGLVHGNCMFSVLYFQHRFRPLTSSANSYPDCPSMPRSHSWNVSLALK